MKRLFFILGFSSSTLGFFFAANNFALAQVTTDSTVDTQVNQNGNVAEITGGETQGSNLFHSFQDFSVPTGNEAFFDNANDISNIFSRVTGGNISNIDGVIRANGSANLFLINPAGIIFGENARLDVGGSFLGSSSSSILFEDGEFSAVDNLQQPVLKINAPIGLGFRDQPGEIVNNSVANNGRGLSVNPGNNISLFGGNVSFDGGTATAPGGTINLGGLSTAGEIGIEPDNTFSFPSEVAQSNILLSNNSIIDVTADGDGLISVNANSLELTGESLLLANIGEDLGSDNAVAGTVSVNAETLNFEDNSAISATSFGRGDAGIVNVNAQSISFDGEWSGIYSNLGLSRIATDEPVSNAVGNAGEINIDTDTFSLTNGARISVNTVAQGDAGNINLNATGLVSFSGVGKTSVPAFDGGTVISGSFSQVQQEGVGNAGEVNINADSLTLLDTGAILTDNSGEEGDAGNITLDITNNISLDRTGLILAQVQEGAVGNGGNIIINAGGSFEAKNNSLILSDTKGIGDAGNININANESISLSDGAQILSEVQDGASGNGGSISLTSGELNLTNNSRIITDTTGTSLNESNTSTAGDINIDVSGDINLDNGNQIQSQTRDGAIGDSGDITIDVGGSLISTNSNKILADSQATGDGGDITINAGEQIILEGIIEPDSSSQIVVGLNRATSNGTGGNIEIKAKELILSDVAFIASNTVTNSQGSAGNINIDVDNLQLSDNALINVLTANDSNGGQITINTQTLDLASGGKILAATDGEGNAGNINLNVSDRITIDNSVSFSPRILFETQGLFLRSLQNFPSGIYADTTDNSTGNGGNVNIGMSSVQVPQEVVISDGGQIIVDSQGTGNGGSIFLTGQTLELNNGKISASTQSSTDSDRSGIITLDIADTLTLKNQSLISAEAFNDANGGNLDIDARFIVAFPGNNDILASAENGIGGNIAIETESLLGIEEREVNDSTNDINASSNFNLDGTVEINILNFDLIQGVTELPRNVVEPRDTIAQACRADRTTANTNSFIITGKGGVSPLPDAPLNSANTIVDGQVDNVSTIPQAIATNQGKIQPARGIKVAHNGEIILTAYQTSNSGDRLKAAKSNCGTDIKH